MAARAAHAEALLRDYDDGVHRFDDKLVLISLLVKLGVAAAVSSSLTRSSVFRNLLLMPKRARLESVKLTLPIVAPLVAGVWIREVVPNFLAADLALETTALVALVVGPYSGVLAATLLALPALLHGEYLALPANLIVSAVLGTFRNFVDVDDVWSFSPLVDLSLYRWVRRNLRRPHFDRQISLLLLIMALQAGASALSSLYPRRYFSLRSGSWLVQLCVCAAAPMVVGIPLKIWNSVRINQQLEEQTRLLLEAKLDALQRQINPHFLFNTLNSIASLVRIEPELAREMVVRLATILRTLLKEREAFVPFREELEFTDNYLGIEVVRFGEKLQVVKQIAPETMDLPVPSMLLQPLIENSIKHGLEPRISGGTVTLRSCIDADALLLEVEDDGVGIDPELQSSSAVKRMESRGTGIGTRNVRERLAVLYGRNASMDVESRPGRGTRVRIRIPLAGSVLETGNELDLIRGDLHSAVELLRTMRPRVGD